MGDLGVKGKLWIVARKAMKEDLGPEVLNQLIQELPEDVRWRMQERLVASEWYSADGIDQMIRLASASLGLTERDYAMQVGRRVVEVSLSRVTDVFVTTFATPKRISKTLQATWDQLYQSGTITSELAPDGLSVHVTQEGWAGHTELQCLNMIGSVAGVASRVRNPTLASARQQTCVSLGDDRCSFIVEFEKKQPHPSH